MPRRILQGTVVSDTNDKTVTVSVERAFQHPVLKKTVRKSKKYRAHDELNAAKKGEIVRIIECAPKSKSKRWELVTQEIDTQLKAAGEARTAEAAVEDAAS
ncbi:MAG: 30S ribosomal protein S17 [Rhodobacteraceae bacterium]|nr:30S ribosomal protein S17 [Paracoccaceae bacterium]